MLRVSKLTKSDKVQRSICESEVHVLSRVIHEPRFTPHALHDTGHENAAHVGTCHASSASLVQWMALYVSTSILLEPRDGLLVSILQDAWLFSGSKLQDAWLFSGSMFPNKNVLLKAGTGNSEYTLIFEYT